MLNAHNGPVDSFILSLASKKAWRLAVDTAQIAHYDLYEAGQEPGCKGQAVFELKHVRVRIF